MAKNIDKLDAKSVSQFAKFIDTLAHQVLAQSREADADDVERLLDHIMDEGGGVSLRGELHRHLKNLVLKRMFAIQDG